MILRLPALLALILLFGLAVACGDDDDGGSATPTIGAGDTGTGEDTPTPTFKIQRNLSLDQYFTQIEAIFVAASITSNDLIAELDSEIALAESFLKQMEANIRFLGETIEVYSTAIGQMTALEPPSEVAAYHQDFIDNATEGATIAADLQVRLEDVSTEGEARDLIQQFDRDIAAVIEEADVTACNLEDVALANNIPVELNCVDS